MSKVFKDILKNTFSMVTNMSRGYYVPVSVEDGVCRGVIKFGRKVAKIIDVENNDLVLVRVGDRSRVLRVLIEDGEVFNATVGRHEAETLSFARITVASISKVRANKILDRVIIKPVSEHKLSIEDLCVIKPMFIGAPTVEGSLLSFPAQGGRELFFRVVKTEPHERGVIGASTLLEIM